VCILLVFLTYWYTVHILYISYVHAEGVCAQKYVKYIFVCLRTCTDKLTLQCSSTYLHYIPIWRHFSQILCDFRTGGTKEHNHSCRSGIQGVKERVHTNARITLQQKENIQQLGVRFQ
jgi:hypothetical protein